MSDFGGTGAMLLGAAASAVVFGLLALALLRPLGWVSAFSMAGFLWAVTVIALVTLTPLTAVDLAIPEEARSTTCSFDVGGPAPDGFWIFQSGQRTLNTVLFIPAGALLVLSVARWRAGWVLTPLGLVGLAVYSAVIEKAQLELDRIDRACDVTDIVDNVTGAVFGVALGLVLIVIFRPWRHKHRKRQSRQPGRMP
ncbi:VanZ family protein [Nocardioides sp. JQ2195]|uniref:VanZ family protein n=1 Tax=Nocardioides sp. JQ2195 TaxID=2592334 RepID=UPI00143ECCC7|nr:VanZ family protein [Nocardioides sp. JQ2195]QIX25296.1 VanZ family protein [Nocardioides sp. JQ2195]